MKNTQNNTGKNKKKTKTQLLNEQVDAHRVKVGKQLEKKKAA